MTVRCMSLCGRFGPRSPSLARHSCCTMTVAWVTPFERQAIENQSFHLAQADALDFYCLSLRLRHLRNRDAVRPGAFALPGSRQNHHYSRWESRAVAGELSI